MDLVVEAVFEDPELKHRVFAEIEDVVEADALLGSNTSSLPITGLAEGVRRPEDFIGLHFFSPVEKMDPVEIIRGEKTSDEALARAVDYTLAIRKYPIVVNDGRGFFTTRVFATFISEGLKMLSEGVDPAVIEQAALQAGYPVGPLQVADELNFATIRRIMDETVRAAEREGTPVPETTRATASVISVMMDEHDRAGRQAGAGFYDYEDGRRGLLWRPLREVFGSRPDGWSMTDLQDRFLFVQAIESQHAFDEGVIASDADANIGSIFGIGFPPRTGGVRQFVKGYPGGPDAFRARSAELAAAYGPRFRGARQPHLASPQVPSPPG